MLRDLLHFAGADAGGARANAPAGAIHQCVDCLQIQIPAALRDIVGVADAVAELRTAATNFTHLRHCSTTLLVLFLLSTVYHIPSGGGIIGVKRPSTAMDHRYIDEHLVADRYLDRRLAPEESGEFEAHLVDCLECRDRLLLAEMFHARNGVSKPQPPLAKLKSEPADAPVPPRIRLVARFAVLQLVLIFAAAAVAAIALMLASAGLFLWAVH